MPLFSLSKKYHPTAIIIGWQACELASALQPHLLDMPIYALTHDPIQTTSAQINTSIVHQHINLHSSTSIQNFFQQLTAKQQHPVLVIFQPPPAIATSTLNTTVQSINSRWQQTAYSLFLISQCAIQHRLRTATRQKLTLIGLGSTLSLHPHHQHSVDSGLYAGIRALLQSLAREFQPKGIHVAHIGLNECATTASVAALCLHLHQQHKTAWSQELECTL